MEKERPEYKVNAQSHIQIKEEVNFGIKDIERVMMSLSNGRMCGPKIYVFLKSVTGKLSNIEQHY